MSHSTDHNDDLMDSIMEIVTDAEARYGELPIAKKQQPTRYDEGYCGHKRIEVDEELRTVACRDCGQALDPIQCLLNVRSYMTQIQHYAWRIAEYERREAEKKARRAKRKDGAR